MHRVHGFWPDVLQNQRVRQPLTRPWYAISIPNDVTSGSPHATPFTSSRISHMVALHKTEPVSILNVIKCVSTGEL